MAYVSERQQAFHCKVDRWNLSFDDANPTLINNDPIESTEPPKAANENNKSWHWYAEFRRKKLKILPGIRAYPGFGEGLPDSSISCPFFSLLPTILTRFCVCFDLNDLID